MCAIIIVVVVVVIIIFKNLYKKVKTILNFYQEYLKYQLNFVNAFSRILKDYIISAISHVL